MHAQGGDLEQAYEKLPASFNTKAVIRPDLLVLARQKRPGIGTTLRHWADDMQQFDGDWEQRKNRARQFFSAFVDQTFREQYAAHVTVVQFFNEIWANSQSPAEKQARVEQDRAAAVVWNQEYRSQSDYAHIELALSSAAVGNDLPIEMAQLSIDEGCPLTYHPYIAVHFPEASPSALPILTAAARATFRGDGTDRRPYRVTDERGRSIAQPVGVAAMEAGQRSPGDWQWCSGRFSFMEQAWGGLKPRWLLTEGSVVRDYTGGLILDPMGGWKLIWGDSASGRQAFYGVLNEWFTDLQGTPAFQEGRVMGWHPFTTGGGSLWQWFELSGAALLGVADLIAANWTVTEPPPDPLPGNGDNLLPGGSFESGDYLQDGIPELQVPNGFYVAWHTGPHDAYPNATSDFVRPEVRRLPASQLPPEERPLFILDGEHTVKIFKGQAPIMARLSKSPYELPAGTYRATLPIYPDLVMDYTPEGQKIFANDPTAGYYQFVINGANAGPKESPFPFGQWYYPAIVFDHPGGVLDIGMRLTGQYGLKNNGWLMDAWKVVVEEVMPPPPPPPPGHTWNKLVYLLPQSTTPAEYDAVQAVAYPTRSEIAFSADSAFARPGNVTGHTVVVYAVSRWGGQSALEAWLAGAGYVYEPPTTIEYREFPAVDPTLVDGYDAPVGTDEERPASAMWPGKWIDANPFLNHYQFGDPLQWAYHTGADLNLNDPVWNMDANAPARAVANGTVTYARLVPTGTWGRLVVIRHKNQDGTFTHSRYGHLRTFNVVEGQTVKRGDVVGSIGGSEYGVPDHLHFDISTSGILETEPKHWPGDNKPLVQQHYVDPKAYIVARRPAT